MSLTVKKTHSEHVFVQSYVLKRSQIIRLYVQLIQLDVIGKYISFLNMLIILLECYYYESEAFNFSFSRLSLFLVASTSPQISSAYEQWSTHHTVGFSPLRRQVSATFLLPVETIVVSPARATVWSYSNYRRVNFLT